MLHKWQLFCTFGKNFKTLFYYDRIKRYYRGGVGESRTA